jgi:DNA helicase HerA-like ATPase
MLKKFEGFGPGHPEYMRYARHLMPLEVLLGHDGERDMVSWVPGQECNGMFLVLGASGSGKTESLKLIGHEIARHGIPLLVLDFHGDVNFTGVNTVLLSSGTQSISGINPLELDTYDSEQVGLYEQRMVLLEMLQRTVRLGYKQKALLLQVIEQAYRHNGILDHQPSTWRNKPPTLSDVLSRLQVIADDRRKLADERNVARGCLSSVKSVLGHPIFLREDYLNTEALLGGSWRFDLSKVTSDGVRYLVAETLLRKIFRALRLKGPIPVEPADDSERFRLFVIIDEAKIMGMAGQGPNDTSLILNILATEGRKFGIGIILASQMSEHFGREIKSNASTWLVLRPMDEREARRNAPDVYVAPAELMALAGRGDGYFRTGSTSVSTRVQMYTVR